MGQWRRYMPYNTKQIRDKLRIFAHQTFSLTQMQQAVIIVAGGSGTRMGSPIPKQFLNVANRPILMHTIETFFHYRSDMQIIVVLPRKEFDMWAKLCERYQFAIAHDMAFGGDTRFESVKNGLALVKGEALTGIHDGVRPLVSTATLERCYADAQLHGNAIPVMPLTESIRRITRTGNQAEDRAAFVSVQTPQVFQWQQIANAYNVPFSPLFTDDASVVEHAGHAIHLTEGNVENIKITTPVDLKIAELLLTKAK